MNRSVSLTVTIILFTFIVVIFDSCLKETDDHDPNSNNDYSIPATTKVIGIDTWDNYFISLDSSDYTLSFQKDLKNDITLSIGDIIVAEAGAGLLRKVNNIREEGDNIIISTSFASLVEAVEEGSFSFDEELTELKVMKINYLSEGVTYERLPIKDGQGTVDRYEFNKHLDDGGLVRLSGYVDLKPALKGDFNISGSTVQDLLVEIRCDEYADIETNIRLLSVEFEKEILIADVNFFPIIASIGPLPVLIVPELELSIGAKFNVETVITTGIQQTLNFVAGLEYKNNTWDSYSNLNKAIDYTPPSLLSASAGVKSYVKPQLNFKIYNIVAPYLFGELYSKFDAELYRYPFPFWELYAGAGIGIGVEVEILDRELLDHSTDPPIIEYIVPLAQSVVDSIIDSRDGKTYYVVQIGDQTWFAQNLNYNISGSWWYDNWPENGETYGRLYTWDAAMASCPPGWHLPGDDEWKSLEMYLGMSQIEADKSGIRGTNEGRMLKSTFGWSHAPSNGNNAVGFWALPGGWRSGLGESELLTVSGFFWTATNSSPGKVWYRGLGSTVENYTKIARNEITVGTEPFAFSVRCLKN